MNHCKICGNKIESFMSFGKMPIANGFVTAEQFSQEYFFELTTGFCDNCHMFQLTEHPDPQMMFHDNYAFLSQTSKHMAIHFEKFYQFVMDEYLATKDNPFVVEIGSNDGILLKHFAKSDIKHLGIEPSANVCQLAKDNGIESICEFFNKQTATDVKQEYGSADVILAANVICHIPDLIDFATGVKHLLKKDGLFIFEEPYLGDVLQKTSYDQIYDEHIYLFSANSIANAFSRVGLELVDVIPQVTHGGSMRYIIGHKNNCNIKPRLQEQFIFEQKLHMESPATYEQFKKNCELSKKNLINTLEELQQQNKQVAGYGATSKSTTVINYCGITPDHISYISDTTPTKIGKYSPGAHIPIKPYQEFAANHPDVAVLFAWNHATEIFLKEKEFSNQKQWLMFVPEVKLIEAINAS